MKNNTRLIEDWFPVNEISIEGIRERSAASALPPINWLHVWWARRPLAISRATVGASLLGSDADRGTFLDAMGTHAQIVQEQACINNARASCDREIPLAVHWRLTKAGASIDPKPKAATRYDGSAQPLSVANCPTDRTDRPKLGVKLLPNEETSKCEFEIVNDPDEISRGTVGRGVAICPYPSCGNTTGKGYLAQAGRIGHVLYCTVYRDSWQEYTKGKTPKERLSTVARLSRAASGG